MIAIDKPADNSTAAPSTNVAVEGKNGTPIKCTVTVGTSTNTYRVGNAPTDDLPLSFTPDGKWGFSVRVPSTTGRCVITVISQNDKDDSVTINLQGSPLPGPGPGEQTVPTGPGEGEGEGEG
jgi:hypothetical protein